MAMTGLRSGMWLCRARHTQRSKEQYWGKVAAAAQLHEILVCVRFRFHEYMVTPGGDWTKVMSLCL